MCYVASAWSGISILLSWGAGCSGGQGGDLIQIPQTVLSKF